MSKGLELISKGWELIIILVCVIMAGVGILILDASYPRVKYYDCSISEISPDFPKEVKEECRKIRRTTV